MEIGVEMEMGAKSEHITNLLEPSLSWTSFCRKVAKQTPVDDFHAIYLIIVTETEA